MKGIVIIDVGQRKAKNLCENRVYISCPITKKINSQAKDKGNTNIQEIKSKFLFQSKNPSISSISLQKFYCKKGRMSTL